MPATAGVELRHVGRAELVRDEDRRRRAAEPGAPLVPGAEPVPAGGAGRRACARRGGPASARRRRGRPAVGSGSAAIASACSAAGGGQRGGGRAAVGQHGRLERGVERRVGGHQHAGLDDLGLGLAALLAQARGERVELLAGRGQRGARRRQRRGALASAGGGPAATARIEDPGAPGRLAGRGREPPQQPLAHQPCGPRARPSAATISAEDVAPGSWWPTERSPR